MSMVILSIVIGLTILFGYFMLRIDDAGWSRLKLAEMELLDRIEEVQAERDRLAQQLQDIREILGTKTGTKTEPESGLAAGPTTGPDRLITLIKNFDKEAIIREHGKWQVSTEWLTGTFAGRVFIANDLTSAVNQLINYLNEHLEHESIVGEIVRESGWPDIDKLKTYLENKDN